jgi:septum formation protein
VSSPFDPHEIPGGLVLASQSPRRQDILTGLGYTFEVVAPPESVEEVPVDAGVHEIPVVLARRKCDAVAAAHPGATVIAADTVVIVDGAILNKPADDAEAIAFIERLSGRTHTVVTGVAVTRDRRHLSGGERTDVTFRELTRREIEAYVATGEGRDKAGSYAAQGVGAGLIRRIDGCFYNVVGLPVALTLDLLREVNHGE